MPIPLIPKTTTDIEAIIADLKRDFAPRHHVHSGSDTPKIDFSQITLPAYGYIRSGQSEFNTGIGFYLGADNGTSKFSIGDPANEHLTWDGSTLSMSGSLIAGELHIPDKDTTANSYHTNEVGDTWWGCTDTNFNMDNENSVAYVLNTGSAKFKDVVLTTNVVLQDIQAGSEISIQNWQQDLVFSVTDADTIAWALGTITLLDGTTYAIDAGNTGNMAATTYIYLDIATSVTVLQTTTTASTAVGSGKIMIAVAKNSTNEALFQVFGGIGGVKLAGSDIENLTVTSGKIANDAITEAKVLADAITAAKINVSGLDGATGDVAANHIIAGMIQTNAITSVKILADAVTAAKINVLGLDGATGRIVVADVTDADVVTGGINTHATTLITAGKIVISGATNLDDWRKAGDLTMIDGGSISTGTVTATQILADTITANEIAAATITAAEIVANTITANEIAANTITASELNVGTLSAIAANLGTITAGSIDINSGVASISSAGVAVFKAISIGGSTVQYSLADEGMGTYGDGSDGALSTTGNVTLSSDKYYTNLTINNGHTFNPNGWRVFVTGTLTFEGTGKIKRSGNNGGNGGNGGSRPTVGTGGAGGAALSAGYLKGSVAGATGADGALGADTGSNGAAASPGGTGTGTSNSIGSNGVAAGGAGGAGSAKVAPCGGTYRADGASSSGGGGGTAAASNVKLIANWHLQTLLDINSSGQSVKFNNSAAGGGGGGGGGGSSASGIDCNSAGCGGGGGGGGSAGGIVAIYAKKIIIGASASIEAKGGNGGNGGTGGHTAGTCDGNGGGGCGGSGANGGQIILVYNEITNNGTISVAAGTGGTAGAGGSGGSAADGGVGSTGANGTVGTIRYFKLSL